MNWNPFKIQYPVEVPNRKGKFAYWFHKQMYFLDIGRGHVVGKITQLFTEVGLLLLILDKLNLTDMSLQIIMILAIIGTVIVWYIGYVYQKIGMDKVYNLVHRERDPMISYMYKDAKRGKKK